MATLTKEQYEALKRQGRGTYRGQTSSSGQFIIEADKFVGDLQGNADTATRLRDPITISLGGDAEGSAQFAGASFRLDTIIREAEHSVNSDVAENAKHSAQASHADLANIATLALRSMLADNASHAEEASHADDSTHADSSDTSTLATRALHADDAYHADEADNATYALKDSNGDNIHNTFVDKQSQITTNTNNIATHEGTLTNHEGRIQQAESNISSLDTRVSDIETSTDVGRITQRIVNIEAKNVEQDGRLDAINDTMVTLSTAQYILAPKIFNAGSKTVMDNEAGATEITNKEYVDNKVLSASRYMTDYVDNKVLSTAQYVDDNFMSLTKSQYVTGLNTYNTVLPQSNLTPTNDNDFITKKYFDENQSSGKLPCEIVISTTPLDDANLHLADGSLLSGSGSYSGFVERLIAKYTANPNLSCWTTENAWQSSVSTYGECGKYVVDTTNNTVRLPKLTTFVQATITASELGSLVEAGAPNITGTLGANWQNNVASGAFSVGVVEANPSFQDGVGQYRITARNASLDANRSSSVYGNSNTVQPQAIKYYFYIVVGTVSKTNIQIDIDNIASDLNGKADKDLSNSVGSWSNSAKIAIAHNAMPSDVYDDLTLGANGSEYIAPADGYFVLQKIANANEVIQFVTKSLDVFILSVRAWSPTTHKALNVWCPVRKGDTVITYYNASGATEIFRFVYAEGSKSEQ